MDSSFTYSPKVTLQLVKLSYLKPSKLWPTGNFFFLLSTFSLIFLPFSPPDKSWSFLLNLIHNDSYDFILKIPFHNHTIEHITFVIFKCFKQECCSYYIDLIMSTNLLGQLELHQVTHFFLDLKQSIVKCRMNSSFIYLSIITLQQVKLYY